MSRPRPCRSSPRSVPFTSSVFPSSSNARRISWCFGVISCCLFVAWFCRIFCAMGTGDKPLLNGLRLPFHGSGGSKKEQPQPSTPKGCLAVMVGLEGEEKQRFVVPVDYLSHPLFQRLLKEAEEEYGFQHKGAIAIPCSAGDFLSIQCQIDHETLHAPSHRGGGSDLHHNLVTCFRA